tara:strand:+ start:894 stop:1163 length:270 start_codon:yes stop_codon:yes gene_type:complete
MNIIYSKPSCPSCVQAKNLLAERQIPFTEVVLGKDITPDELFTIFDEKELPRPKSAPQVFLGDKHIGGYEALVSYVENTGFNGTGYSVS